MAKSYFTLCLDCEGKDCLMIGGGDEAFEKSVRFWEAGANLSVVSRRFNDDFREWLEKEKIPYQVRDWVEGDVRAKFFAINTIKSDPAVSQAIWDACRRENCLLSAYDQPKVCNIAMAALARVGKLRIAISSNGQAPTVARRLRLTMEADLFDQEFVDFVDWVAEYREDMVRQGVEPQERRRRLRGIMKGFRVTGGFRYPREFPGRRGLLGRLRDRLFGKRMPVNTWPGPKD